MNLMILISLYKYFIERKSYPNGPLQEGFPNRKPVLERFCVR
jgi:hypothetical protein